MIAERPGIQQRLRQERDLIPSFTEEALRMESPVKGDFRLARVPAAIGGTAIAAGTTVMVLNGAANRDPAGARRYRYLPTFILRGLTRLHLEFTSAGEQPR